MGQSNNNFKIQRGSPPAGKFNSMDKDDMLFVLNDASHPVLRTSMQQFKEIFHESILFIASRNGSKPSMNVPKAIVLPESHAYKVICLTKKFNIESAPSPGEEVLLKSSIVEERTFPLCNLRTWFIGVAEMMVGTDNYFCPRSLEIKLDPTIIDPIFKFEYMEVFGTELPSPKVFTLDLFKYLKEEEETTDIDQDELVQHLRTLSSTKTKLDN